MGAQRATKILGIFARLDRRDGKPHYLRHLPRIEAISPATSLIRRSPTCGPGTRRTCRGSCRLWPDASRARALRLSEPMSTACSPHRHAAMVLAAGLGKRMRPITTPCRSRWSRSADETLIDHALDRLADAGVETAVVNVHYLADQIEAHLARPPARRRSSISDERDALLETGGGVKKALPLLGDGAFFVLNADSFWIEGPRPNLGRAACDAWDPERMDILLLRRRRRRRASAMTGAATSPWTPRGA